MAPSRHARRVGRCPLSGANRKTFTRLSLPLLNPKPTTEVKATMKTARLWRGILPSTHLAREGRMTVTIGRRELLAALGGAAAAWPLPGPAHPRPRPAFLALGPQQNVPLAFVDGLRRLGYAQGRNFDIDHRYGDVEKLKPLAEELIALKPDILVADSPSGAIAFKSVAPTLPIVCLALT